MCARACVCERERERVTHGVYDNLFSKLILLISAKSLGSNRKALFYSKTETQTHSVAI